MEVGGKRYVDSLIPTLKTSSRHQTYFGLRNLDDGSRAIHPERVAAPSHLSDYGVSLAQPVRRTPSEHYRVVYADRPAAESENTAVDSLNRIHTTSNRGIVRDRTRLHKRLNVHLLATRRKYTPPTRDSITTLHPRGIHWERRLSALHKLGQPIQIHLP